MVVLSWLENYTGCLWNSETKEPELHTDIAFVCKNGESVRAHFLILAENFPKMVKLINDATWSPFSKTKVSFFLPDVSPKTLKVFLQLLYRGKVFIDKSADQELQFLWDVFGTLKNTVVDSIDIPTIDLYNSEDEEESNDATNDSVEVISLSDENHENGNNNDHNNVQRNELDETLELDETIELNESREYISGGQDEDSNGNGIENDDVNSTNNEKVEHEITTPPSSESPLVQNEEVEKLPPRPENPKIKKKKKWSRKCCGKVYHKKANFSLHVTIKHMYHIVKKESHKFFDEAESKCTICGKHFLKSGKTQNITFHIGGFHLKGMEIYDNKRPKEVWCRTEKYQTESENNNENAKITLPKEPESQTTVGRKKLVRKCNTEKSYSEAQGPLPISTQTKGNENYNYNCCYCDHRFTTFKIFLRHLQGQHLKKEVEAKCMEFYDKNEEKCKICQKFFKKTHLHVFLSHCGIVHNKTLEVYNEIREIHDGNINAKPNSAMPVNPIKKVIKKRKRNRSSGPHRCRYCNQTFSTSTRFCFHLIHSANHIYPSVRNKSKKFYDASKKSCLICDKVLKGDFAKHIGTVHLKALEVYNEVGSEFGNEVDKTQEDETLNAAKDDDHMEKIETLPVVMKAYSIAADDGMYFFGIT